MPAATDAQMQAYCDQRIRVRAEQLRAAINGLTDDRTALEGGVYERAVGTAWADARTDGPPKLLANSDVLVYNSIAALLLKCVAGTATLQDVADLAGNWPVFMSACVRPVGG